MTFFSTREPAASILTPVKALIQMLLATRSEAGMVAGLAEYLSAQTHAVNPATQYLRNKAR